MNRREAQNKNVRKKKEWKWKWPLVARAYKEQALVVLLRWGHGVVGKEDQAVLQPILYTVGTHV